MARKRRKGSSKAITFTVTIGGRKYKGKAYPRKSGSGWVANILVGRGKKGK